MRAVTLLMCALFSDAALAQGETGELLSLDTVTVSGTPIHLEKTLRKDGLVCQSYIADSSANAEGVLLVELDEICGKPVSFVPKAGELGSVVLYPDNLHSMYFDQHAGRHILKLNN